MPLNGTEYPLYENSYHMSQVSPLHCGRTPFNNQSLQIHAQRFHDILVGGMLRGVEVNSNSNSESSIGALKTVTFRTLTEERHWAQDRIQREQDSSLPGASDRGILVVLEYERTIYRAIMLRDVMSNSRNAGGGDGFEHFPLLLSRIPTATMEKFVSYLSQNFDARLQQFHLPRSFMIATLDMYIHDLCGPAHTGAVDSTENEAAARIVGDITLACGRPNNDGGLRSFHLLFKQQDIPRFLAQTPAADRGPKSAPFVDAAKQYIYKNVGVDIFHHALHWETVACSAFTLGVVGRLRLSLAILDNQKFANWQLVCALINEAATTNINRH